MTFKANGYIWHIKTVLKCHWCGFESEKPEKHTCKGDIHYYFGTDCPYRKDLFCQERTGCGGCEIYLVP